MIDIQKINALCNELFGICRSLTGDGVRQTFSFIKKIIPLSLFEIPSGTKVFDWTVPDEWNIAGGQLTTCSGDIISSFSESNVSIMSYSVPIQKKLSLFELHNHVHMMENAIPYRTSYYTRDWAFCMKTQTLPDCFYDVEINSSLVPGAMTIGEFFVPGKKKDEILITTYTCHPSLANDNLSGIVLTTFLAQYISSMSLEFSYRFLFLPETIGIITWLAKNENKLCYIKGALVVTCVGDSGDFTLKLSKNGSFIERCILRFFREKNIPLKSIPFSPTGSDERQLSSPKFGIPTCSLMRTPYKQYKEYHSSNDDLSFINTKNLLQSINVYKEIIHRLDENKFSLCIDGYCEPFYSKYGLYPATGAKQSSEKDIIRWIMNYADGSHSNMDIAEKSGFDLTDVDSVSFMLKKRGLLT